MFILKSIDLRREKGMFSKDIKKQVKILWDYMKLNQIPQKSDCILGLGCHDINIAKRCSELYLAGYSNYVIFSGGLGKITEKLWNKSEAEKFAEIAINMGVPKEKIYIESNSTNTGDNLIFTKSLIKKNNLSIKSFIVVTKPCAERRIRATFEKQMPEFSAIYTSPSISFDEYMQIYENGPVSQNDMINALVGDIQRFEAYYLKGFQVHVDVPKEILEAYTYLVNAGFNKYIVK